MAEVTITITTTPTELVSPIVSPIVAALELARKRLISSPDALAKFAKEMTAHAERYRRESCPGCEGPQPAVEVDMDNTETFEDIIKADHTNIAVRLYGLLARDKNYRDVMRSAIDELNEKSASPVATEPKPCPFENLPDDTED